MKQPSPPVLYFHSVAPEQFSDWTLNFLTMGLDRFEAQMQYLQAKGFRAVFFEEWLEARQGARPANGKEICLSFDDGLLDNWVYAFPMAKKYGLKLTLFVCPELVDPRDIVRPNLDDLWAGRVSAAELEGLGNLSWAELRSMQASGYADVQSHTMSHAKYPVSDRLRGFYYGGFEGFYPCLNTYPPEGKPFYMNDPGFKNRLPAGTPLFEESSAVTARKHTINPHFFEEAAALARGCELEHPNSRLAYEKAVRQLHDRYRTGGVLVSDIETDAEYLQRLEYEIAQSKQIIETQLGKPVRFLCWPHGDNSHQAHILARQAGYAATTAGKMTDEAEQPDRIPRIGTDWNIGPWWMRRKLDYKLSSHFRQQPYYSLWLANEYKNRILQRI